MAEESDATMEDNSDTESESPSESADAMSRLSSDSDFYGSLNMKEAYRKKIQEVEPDNYWRVHDWNVQVIAAKALKLDPNKWPDRTPRAGQKRKREDDNSERQSKVKKQSEACLDSTEFTFRNPPTAMSSSPTKPFNPYEGNSTALQIDESIQSFLSRLPPSTSETQAPWIWAANFHSPERPTKPDIATFRQRGTRLLDAILAKRAELEAKFDPPKPEAAITRMMAVDRATLEKDVLALAKECELTSGKWMLFPTKDKVDKYWEAVVYGTVEGRLGTAAKVATRPEKPDEPTQVICVYTKDITDEDDIKRVLLELVKLGVTPKIVNNGGKKGVARGQIWYKPDCYTYLDISSGNEYRIRPTLYGSAEMLK